MEHDGSFVTLIFYRVGERWWKEPLLNIIAAAAQMSSLTHVEISIGGPCLGTTRTQTARLTVALARGR